MKTADNQQNWRIFPVAAGAVEAIDYGTRDISGMDIDSQIKIITAGNLN
jgi:hypothetical protein